jgi:hypothetical protein
MLQRARSFCSARPPISQENKARYNTLSKISFALGAGIFTMGLFYRREWFGFEKDEPNENKPEAK